MTLKEYICRRLDAGMDVKSAWQAAERDRWHAPWNYVRKIARDWAKEKSESDKQ